MNEIIKSLDWTEKQKVHRRGAYLSSNPLTLETYGFLKTAYPYNMNLHMLFTSPKPVQIPATNGMMEELDYGSDFGFEFDAQEFDDYLNDLIEDYQDYEHIPEKKKAKKKK